MKLGAGLWKLIPGGIKIYMSNRKTEAFKQNPEENPH